MPGSFSIRRRCLPFVLPICLCCGMLMSTPSETIPADPASESSMTCDIHKGPCSKELAGLTVTLDILPRPVRAMKDLTFRVFLSGEKKIGIPSIDLGMPGMNMGPNRVNLKRVKNNVFEGQGIIVRCPSGRRTWKATVTLPEAGQVEFVFDVIY